MPRESLGIHSGNLFWPGGEVQIAPQMTLNTDMINQRLGALGANVNNTYNDATLNSFNRTYNVVWGDPIQRNAAIGTTRGLVEGFRDIALADSGNPFGLSDSKGVSGKGKFNLKGAATGILGAVGGTAGKLLGNAIAGGYSTGGVGEGVADVGNMIGGAMQAIPGVGTLAGTAVQFASGLIGGAINRGWGVKENKENVAAIKQNTAQARSVGNAVGGAATNDDVLNSAGMMTTSSGFSAGDLYKNGWFTNKGTKKGNELIGKENAALAFQNHGLVTGAGNADSNMDSDVMRNFAAYGGPLGFGEGALGLMKHWNYMNTIDNRSAALAGKNTNNVLSAYTGGARTMADGGSLEADFLSDFSSNPIGAVMRYNQGLEQLADREEAERAQAAREAEYSALQQRMVGLEIQNQGLQAMLAAQATAMPAVTTEAPVSSPTPSKAARAKKSGNATWDYIEQQLRDSGKFNDVQIAGIKYNLQRESALNPDAVGDGGAAFGLGQWHGSRQPKDRSLEGQTKHLIETLGNYDGKEHWIGRGNYDGFLNARTPEEAHYYIAKGYERPAAFITDKLRREMAESLKAFGGELGTNGTDWTSGLLHVDAGGRHEENPLEGVPMGVDSEGVPNLVEEGETVWNDYVFSDRMDVPEEAYNELGLGDALKKHHNGRSNISFADASKKLAQESEQRPNDPISKAGLEASMSRLAEVQEAERMKQQMKEYVGLDGYACGGKLKNKFGGGGDSNNPYGDDVKLDGIKSMVALNTDGLRKIKPMSVAPQPNLGINPSKALQDELKSWDAVAKERYLRNAKTEVPGQYSTWMRYAPAFGSGLMTLTDALGLTNKPDYTYANKLEAVAERAGYAPEVNYTPIGDYLAYRPMDIWNEQNRLNANSRATERAILNSGANQGAKMAGLLAAGYNDQVASGDLYRKALEYNDAKRKDVAEFNRRTNMFNSQMGLEAAMANARYRQQASQMGLSGLAQAAALRDDIDKRVSASRAANLSNFLTSLGNIGRENMSFNMLNSTSAARNGYWIDRNGVVHYTNKGKSNG